MKLSSWNVQEAIFYAKEILIFPKSNDVEKNFPEARQRRGQVNPKISGKNHL